MIEEGECSAILLFALRDQLGINLAGVVVGFLGLRTFGIGNLGSLLRPALVDSGKTPLRALTRGANGFPFRGRSPALPDNRQRKAPATRLILELELSYPVVLPGVKNRP